MLHHRFKNLETKPDLVFLGIVVGLIIFGLVALSSASGPLGLSRFNDSYHFFKHQITNGLLPGIVAMIVMMYIPYRTWKKFAFPLLFISIILLVLVFVPGIQANFGTARSWIKVGPISLQPSELVKLTFLFYLAAWLETRGEGVKDFKMGFLPFIFLVGTIMTLLILEPDTGSMAVIVFEAIAVYFIAGSAIKHLLLMGGSGIILLIFAIKLSPYRVARFMTFLYPELDPQGIGYHVNQALLAVGSGGFFGLGLGHSRQKFLYLPEVQGDSIFAIIAEEMGFFFSVAIICLFIALLWRGFKIANRAPDKFGKYVTVGILSWITIQALVNIGAMIGILPVTGITLPFVSYGGSALVVAMAGMGTVLNISKQYK